jgi:two-component system, chemotaxis family, protein-glutamate methylesterase/glutaminase
MPARARPFEERAGGISLATSVGDARHRRSRLEQAGLMSAAAARRIVVIGASAGGVEALPGLLATLPASLDACVLVVLHLRAGSGEHLLPILQRRCALHVEWAQAGRTLDPGHVFVAPPDLHLVVGDAQMNLVAGPRENRARPSINRLFRSAAAHHDARVIGVLLTGCLDDGSAGLVAIRRCGGVVLVQDPREAAFPEMPRNAIEAVAPDAILPLTEVGPAIERVVATPPMRASVPDDVALEAELDGTGRLDMDLMPALGPPSSVSCPDCGGPMWTVGGPRSLSYRCFVGHAVSAHTLIEDKEGEIERSLWCAVRALEERSATLSHLARDARRIGSGSTAADYELRSRESQAHALRARDFLLELRRSTGGSSPQSTAPAETAPRRSPDRSPTRER